MAKKTAARKQAVTRRAARAPEPKAPAAPVAPPPVGRAATRSARGRRKGAQDRPESRPVETLKSISKATRAAAERAFVEGLIARGEVAESGAELDAGMTHEVVGPKGSATPQVTRRRFSLR